MSKLLDHDAETALLEAATARGKARRAEELAAQAGKAKGPAEPSAVAAILPAALAGAEAPPIGAAGVTYSRRCPDCGVPIQMARNAPTTRCPKCAVIEAGARRRTLHATALARIPEAFQGVFFGSKRLESGCRDPEARALAERYASFRETHLILLLGPTGAGKTTLAAAIFRQLADRVAEPRTPTAADEYYVANLVWAHARAIASARRQSPLGEEAPLIAAAKRASVLVVDDLGQESPADKDELIEVISWREEKLRPTIVTCGFDVGVADDGGRYGPHFERRLTERKGVIVIGSGT